MNLFKKSHKNFTYKFYDDIEHLYSCLTNKYILNERIFKDLISNLKTNNNNPTENKLQGMSFYFDWKNKYKIEILIEENEYKYENKVIGLLFLKINEFKNPIKININCYWNSCEFYTFIFIEILIYDENIKNIINEELSKENIEKFFQNIENYIKYDYSCLTQFDSILIEKNIKEVFNYIKDFSKIIPFFFPNKKIHLEQINDVYFGDVIYVYEKNVKYEYKVSGILISDDRICIKLNKKMNNENYSSIKLSIDKCDEQMSSFFIKHQFKKYVNSKDIKQLSKMKKNCFKFLKTNLGI